MNYMNSCCPGGICFELFLEVLKGGGRLTLLHFGIFSTIPHEGRISEECQLSPSPGLMMMVVSNVLMFMLAGVYHYACNTLTLTMYAPVNLKCSTLQLLVYHCVYKYYCYYTY